MKERVRITLGCFVFAIATDLLIAVWCGVELQLTGPRGSARRTSQPTALERWWQGPGAETGLVPDYYFVRIGQHAAVGAVVARIDDRPPRWRVLQTVEAGWPFASRYAEGEMVVSGPIVRNDGSWAVPRLRLIPLRPVWSGLVANLAIFFLPPFLTLMFLRAVRNSIRRSKARRNEARGACRQCSYDLRGDLARGCPECGWRRPEGLAQPPG